MRVSPLLSIEVRRYQNLHFGRGTRGLPHLWPSARLLSQRQTTQVRLSLTFVSTSPKFVDVRTCIVIFHAAFRGASNSANTRNAKLPEPESKSRSNSLLAKVVSTRRQHDREGQSRRTLRVSSRQHAEQQRSQACRQKRETRLSPPLIAIYNAYPQPRAGILRLSRAQPSSRRNYYLARSRRIAAN